MRIQALVLITLSLGLCSVHGAEEDESVFKLGQRFYSDSLYNLALEQYQKYLTLPRPPENDPVVYYRIALCELRMNNMRQAASGFDEYARLFPGHEKNMDALFNAGRAYASLGEHKEASERFLQVWSRFVGSARAQAALYRAAVSAQEYGGTERAVELYDTYLRRFPRDEKAKEVALSLAKLHMASREYAAAEEVLEEADDVSGGDKEFERRLLYRKALLAMRMQRTQEAAEYFASMMKMSSVEFSELEEAYRAYLEFLVSGRKYGEALDVYAALEDAVTRRGGRLAMKTLYSWAECARKAKAYQQAEKLYLRLLKTHSDSVNQSRVRFSIADCRIGRDDFAGAIELLQSVTMEDSAGKFGARAVLKIGDLYYSRGLFVASVAAYRRYLQLPTSRNADGILFRIGVIYQDQFSQFGSASREFEELLKRYPSSPHAPEAVFRLAQCLEELGDHQAALRNYRYLTESNEAAGIGKRARERAEYLETYRIKDVESAAQALAGILAREDEALPRYERLMQLAHLHERHLKDYDRANELYEAMMSLEPPAPDTVRAKAAFGMARNHERLARKAAIEGSDALKTYAEERALKLYGDVMETYGGSRWADDAAYRIMMVSEPGIGELERFVAEYPKSQHAPEVLHNIAEHYEREARKGGKGAERKAVKAYATVATRYPSSRLVPQALLGMARGYLVLGMPDSTQAVVDELFSRFDQAEWRPEGLYLRGVVQRRRGAHREAIETFRNVLYQYPFSRFAGQVRYELAESQLASGSIVEALGNLRIYVQNHPKGEHRHEAVLGTGECLARMGKVEEAQAMLNDLLDQELGDGLRARANYVLAGIAEQSGDIYRALDLYKKVLGADGFGDRERVYGHVASLYFENRIYDEAADVYEKAYRHARTHEDSAQYLRRGTTALIMAGKSAQADKLIATYKERYGEDNPGFAEIVYHEGIRLVQVKEYDKALNRFKYILKKYPNSERADDAAYQTGLALFYQGDKESAMQVFTDFGTRYPNSEFVPYAQFKMAMILHEREEYLRAAELFAIVAAQEEVERKTRFRAASNAALDYQKVTAWSDAAALYRRILAEFPDDVPASAAHLKIGFCLVQASRFEEAIKHFQKASINPAPQDKPEVLYWLGMSYAKSGQYQKALTELLKVPYLHAGEGKWGVTAEMEAARLYERLGEYGRAKSLYAKIIRSDGENGQFGKAASARLKQLSNLVAESP